MAVFFCSRDPIDQAAEDIVFAIDSEQGEVTMHVQVAYTGSAEEFAWILPIAEVPELLLSTDQLFQELSWRTRPQFQLEIVEALSDCAGYPYYGGRSYEDVAFSPAPPAGQDENTTVEVISEQRVGPYETVVIRGESSEGLLDWLQENKYFLPDDLGKVLDPYVAGNSYFVALRLAKDNDVGDLAPLALTYAGTAASIPIQLTSIAATEDMRVRAYVLGDTRAVPDSYLHVQVNHLAIDWFRNGSNWEDAITIAANEAGGQAFATDYSGTTDLFDDVFYRDGQFDIDGLAQQTDAIAFFNELQNQGFSGSNALLELFREFLPLPAELADQGVTAQQFYNSLDYYSEYVDDIPFDSTKFAAAIDERIVQPLANVQAMFDGHPHMTRMTSSVSPVEMTVDPTFVFNRQVTQSVELLRTATIEYYCDPGMEYLEAPRRLVLEDGRAYELPSTQWFFENNLTEYEYLLPLLAPYALVIEDMGATGQPVVVFDGLPAEEIEADEFNESSNVIVTPTGCGCQHGSSGGLAISVLVALGLAFRRRRTV